MSLDFDKDLNSKTGLNISQEDIEHDASIRGPTPKSTIGIPVGSTRNLTNASNLLGETSDNIQLTTLGQIDVKDQSDNIK